MGVRIGRKGSSLCPLPGIHAIAWAQPCGPMVPSLCLLAGIHETSWASASPGWGHPLRCLPASVGLHGRPRRADGCILSVHADTHHGPWMCPWSELATCVRATRAPMQPHGCVLPVDAGASRADADTDPWQRMVPSAGRAHPWVWMDIPVRCHRYSQADDAGAHAVSWIQGYGATDGSIPAPAGPFEHEGAGVRLLDVRIGGIGDTPRGRRVRVTPTWPTARAP
jgi:hypothetical protein